MGLGAIHSLKCSTSQDFIILEEEKQREGDNTTKPAILHKRNRMKQISHNNPAHSFFSTKCIDNAKEQNIIIVNENPSKFLPTLQFVSIASPTLVQLGIKRYNSSLPKCKQKHIHSPSVWCKPI